MGDRADPQRQQCFAIDVTGGIGRLDPVAEAFHAAPGSVAIALKAQITY